MGWLQNVMQNFFPIPTKIQQSFVLYDDEMRSLSAAAVLSVVQY